jgi:hypothetical protein
VREHGCGGAQDASKREASAHLCESSVHLRVPFLRDLGYLRALSPDGSRTAIRELIGIGAATV